MGIALSSTVCARRRRVVSIDIETVVSVRGLHSLPSRIPFGQGADSYVDLV